MVEYGLAVLLCLFTPENPRSECNYIYMHYGPLTMQQCIKRGRRKLGQGMLYEHAVFGHYECQASNPAYSCGEIATKTDEGIVSFHPTLVSPCPSVHRSIGHETSGSS